MLAPSSFQSLTYPVDYVKSLVCTGLRGMKGGQTNLHMHILKAIMFLACIPGAVKKPVVPQIEYAAIASMTGVLVALICLRICVPARKILNFGVISFALWAHAGAVFVAGDWSPFSFMENSAATVWKSMTGLPAVCIVDDVCRSPIIASAALYATRLPSSWSAFYIQFCLWSCLNVFHWALACVAALGILLWLSFCFCFSTGGKPLSQCVATFRCDKF